MGALAEPLVREVAVRAWIWIVAGCVEYNPVAGVGPATLPGAPTPETITEAEVLDVFEGGGAATVDVIVFGDTSGSMDEELETLAQTITPFVERLATHIEDWQLAAVTEDHGCSASGVLGPDTPRFAEVFADAIVDEADDGEETGLLDVTRAVEKSGPGQCNEGLVRGGTLQIVFVSDENEESPGYDEAPSYWRSYLDRIGEAHGDASRVKMSAVIGPTPLGCPGADPGFGYDAVVAATGGQTLSICGDWASQIDLIADAVPLRTNFPLSEVPIPRHSAGLAQRSGAAVGGVRLRPGGQQRDHLHPRGDRRHGVHPVPGRPIGPHRGRTGSGVAAAAAAAAAVTQPWACI